MDVRCTSTGKVFYQIDTQIAALLIEALPTVFEKLAPPPPEKKIGSLKFNFDRTLTTGEPRITYRCDACGQGSIGTRAEGPWEKADGACIFQRPGVRKRPRARSSFGIAGRRKSYRKHSLNSLGRLLKGKRYEH